MFVKTFLSVGETFTVKVPTRVRKSSGSNSKGFSIFEIFLNYFNLIIIIAYFINVLFNFLEQRFSVTKGITGSIMKCPIKHAKYIFFT